MMKFLKNNTLKFLWVIKVEYIVLLITAILTQVIVNVLEVVVICLLIPATLAQVIVEVVDVGQICPATLTLVIAEDMLI